MLTAIDVKIIFDTACLSASLGDERLFSSANIFQIADVVRRVVFLLFMLCFEPKVCLFLPYEKIKKFSHLNYYQNNSTSCLGFLG